MGQEGSDDWWILEHSVEPVGMIARDKAGFVFHTAGADVGKLDRQVFPTMYAAQRAARQAAVQVNRRPSGERFEIRKSFKRGPLPEQSFAFCSITPDPHCHQHVVGPASEG